MASEDMDSLTFGAPKFLRHLMDPSSRKIPVMEFVFAFMLISVSLLVSLFSVVENSVRSVLHLHPMVYVKVLLSVFVY